MKKCVLEINKVCDDCGECGRCDLNRNKTCDNCCECIALKKDFETIYIDKLILNNKLKK